MGEGPKICYGRSNLDKGLLQPALPPPTCLAGANSTLSPFAWNTKFKSKPFGGGAGFVERGVSCERLPWRGSVLERTTTTLA